MGGKGRISPERRRDSTIAVCSGCATFVPMMESTDLGKCEAELHVIRARLRGGIINKARRGELDKLMAPSERKAHRAKVWFLKT